MLLVDIDMPHDCWQCKIENLVHNCPCMQGVASASDYKDCRHPNCPIQEVNEVQMVDIKDLLKRVEELETAVADIKDWKENIESAEDNRLAEMGW